MSLMQPVRALINTPLGQRIKPFGRRIVSRLVITLGMVVQPGAQTHDPSKPTAVVASHEASTTGAPILALNLAQQLSATHNVVVLLLRGGALKQQFRSFSTACIQARYGLASRRLLRQALHKASPPASRHGSLRPLSPPASRSPSYDISRHCRKSPNKHPTPTMC